MTGRSFDLIHEPWIPCVGLEHHPITLGLLQVIEEAHELRCISDSSPLVTLSIHRVLLAILHRVLDGPGDQATWRALWEAGQLPAEEIGEYLGRWSDRFDLFHHQYPFFQVAEFATVDKQGEPTPPVPVARLAVERAAGNNAVLFDHGDDRQPAVMDAAQAARALIATQAFALGGGQGPSSNRFGKHPYTSHASQVGGVAVLLRGSNLAETLLLNLVPYDHERPVPRRGDDLPVWERTDPRPPQEVVVDGYLDYLTLPCRYVRLVPEEHGGELTVRHAYIAPGLSLPSGDAAPTNPLWFYRLDEKRGRVPIPLRVDRAIWRDSSPLFALPAERRAFDGRPQALRQARSRAFSRLLGADARLMVACFGLANDKAKALTWRCEELPAPIRLLEDPDLVAAVADAVGDAEQAAQALRKAFRSLAYRVLEANEKAPDKNDVGRLALRMESRAGFWSELDEPFLRFLDGLASDPTRASGTWTRTVYRSARASFTRGSRSAQGAMGRRMRALVLAEKALFKNLYPLRKRIPKTLEEEE